MQKFERLPADAHLRAPLEHFIDLEGLHLEGGASHRAKEALQSKIPGELSPGVDGTAVLFLDGGGIKDMVEVLVSQQESRDGQATLFDPCGHALRGIDKKGAGWEDEEMAIGGGDTTGKGFYSRHRQEGEFGKQWTFRWSTSKISAFTGFAAYLEQAS